METVNVIEIDYEGQVAPLREYQFEYLPRTDERIILSLSNGDPKIYQVKDVHHTPDKKTTIYVMNDYRSLEDVIQSIAKTSYG
ncbi:hypothetical protein [Reichenbachiella sp. MALMAid0571]|uniref:hypothetical protein n=1 Tax=Reichenbachiella sp. MALMAid0571 TaxID=3143939 RepID=UPI0032DF123A